MIKYIILAILFAIGMVIAQSSYAENCRWSGYEWVCSPGWMHPEEWRDREMRRENWHRHHDRETLPPNEWCRYHRC